MSMTKRTMLLFALALPLGMGGLPAQAARVFNARRPPTPAPGQFDMATSQSVTMNVTNTIPEPTSTREFTKSRFRLYDVMHRAVHFDCFFRARRLRRQVDAHLLQHFPDYLSADLVTNAVATVASGGPTQRSRLPFYSQPARLL